MSCCDTDQLDHLEVGGQVVGGHAEQDMGREEPVLGRWWWTGGGG